MFWMLGQRGDLKVFLFSYVDDALLVSKHQVSEEAGLGHLSQVDHVVHALGQRRVHDPEGGLQLPGQTVLLEGASNCVSKHLINHKDIRILRYARVYLPLIVHQ